MALWVRVFHSSERGLDAKIWPYIEGSYNIYENAAKLMKKIARK